MGYGLVSEKRWIRMPVKEGDVIELHYTIKVLEDGKETLYETTQAEVAKEHNAFDPNKRYSPIFVVVGKSKLLDPIEKAIREMDVGEKKEVIAKPEEAFGPYRKELVITIPIKALRRSGIRPRVGEEIEVEGRRGVITKVTERFAYIDFNHPLAGKTLKIEIEIVRKLESEDEKIKAIVLRYLPLKEETVNVEVKDGVANVELPGSVIVVRDLDSLLQSILSTVYELTTVKELVFTIKIPLKREEEKKEEEETQVQEEKTVAEEEETVKEEEKEEGGEATPSQ